MASVSLRSRIRGIILASVTLMTGITGCKDRTTNEKSAPNLSKSAVHQIEKEVYHVNVGVLMPLVNETKADYHLRLERLRLEEQEEDAQMKDYTRRKVEELLAKQHLDGIDMNKLGRWKKELKTPMRVLIDYYSPEGQEKIKQFRKNTSSPFVEIQSSGSCGQTYDF